MCARVRSRLAAATRRRVRAALQWRSGGKLRTGKRQWSRASAGKTPQHKANLGVVQDVADIACDFLDRHHPVGLIFLVLLLALRRCAVA